MYILTLTNAYVWVGFILRTTGKRRRELMKIEILQLHLQLAVYLHDLLLTFSKGLVYLLTSLYILSMDFFIRVYTNLSYSDIFQLQIST